jgi:hypothetical protein
MYAIHLDTGFYLENVPSVMLFNILLPVLAAFCFAAAFFGVRHRASLCGQPFVAAACFAGTGLIFCGNAIYEAVEWFRSNQNDLFSLGDSVLMLLSGGALIFGASAMLSVRTFKYASLIFLIPPIHMLVRISKDYLGFTTVVTVSEHLMTTLSGIGLMCFLLYNSAALSGNLRESAFRRLLISSSVGAVAVLVPAVTRLVMYFVGGVTIEESLPMVISDLLLGIAMVAVLS